MNKREIEEWMAEQARQTALHIIQTFGAFQSISDLHDDPNAQAELKRAEKKHGEML